MPKEKARLLQPSAICLDPTVPGAVLIGTDDNPQRVIRRVSARGEADIIAGQDYFLEPEPDEEEDMAEWAAVCLADAADARDTCFSDIAALLPATLAGRGGQPEILIASLNGNTVRALNPRTRQITRVVGTGERGAHTDGSLIDPFALAVDSRGRLLIACLEGYSILRFDGSAPAARRLECVAGRASRSAYRDGPGADALLGDTAGLCVDAHDTVYFCDYTNNAIRAISPEGYVYSIVASHAAQHTDVCFDLHSPFGILFDHYAAARGQPRLYVLDFHRVVQIDLDPSAMPAVRIFLAFSLSVSCGPVTCRILLTVLPLFCFLHCCRWALPRADSACPKWCAPRP